MLVFLDTEFTDLYNNPKLFSIGLISENGEHSFYAELYNTYTQADLSDFAIIHVVPILDGDNVLTFEQLSIKLKAWIVGLNDEVTIASDNQNWDWNFIKQIFRQSWPENLNKECFLLNVNYICNVDVYFDAVENAFKSGL